ncbi:MAG: STAS domain-containing protein [Actinobacteria bacterium]|nr:STAS domain-containing protein [Actinomycetota bacterium]
MSLAAGDFQEPRSTSAEFLCDAHLDHSRAIVLVNGEIDLLTAPRLRETLERLISQGAVRIDIDLREVSFLDSQGIGLLVSTHKRLEEADGQLRVLQPPAPVRKLLRITGIDALLEVVP